MFISLRKRIYFLTVALMSASLYCMEESFVVGPEKRWRNSFNKFIKGNHYRTLKKTLGYDLQLELICDDRDGVVHQSGPTVCVHGWGADKHSFSRSLPGLYNNIPGDKIIFNLYDARSWYNPITPIYRSSFAGEKDQEVLEAVLWHLSQSANIYPAVIYCHSRGAGTVMATLGKIGKMIESGGSDEKKAYTKIMKSIKMIYLLNPLASFDSALKQQIRSTLPSLISYLFPRLTDEIIFNWLKYTVLPRWTLYKPEQEDPIDCVKKWKEFTGTIWLHLEDGDESVSNDQDITLVKKLLLFYDNATSFQLLVSKIKDGSHNAYRLFINGVVDCCNKQCKASYLPQNIQNDSSNTNSAAIVTIRKTTEFVNSDYIGDYRGEYIQQHFDTFLKKHTSRFTLFKTVGLLWWGTKISLLCALIWCFMTPDHYKVMLIEGLKSVTKC